MASKAYQRAHRAASAQDLILTALVLRHARLPQPVRVINDTVDRSIGRYRYTAVRFEIRLADDTDGRTPQAELSVDNVGRELTQWIDRADGGVGVQVRVMQFMPATRAIEWEQTLDVVSVRLDQRSVVLRLGFDPLLGRAAVPMRYDPQTAPGLF